MNIIEILEQIKIDVELITDLSKEFLVSRGSDNGFEKLIPLIIKKIISPYENISMVEHYGHHFPDVDIIIDGQRYGIELKSRNNGTWATNGNSVFESISNEEYCEIYLLFGSKEKNKNHFLIRYSPYWQVTNAITVTHSPRFKIDMNTDTSVFSSEEEYDKLREMSEQEKVVFLQSYLKKNTSGVKWFVPQDVDSIKPVSLNSLELKIRNRVQAEVFVLYPQDLIHKSEGTFRSNYSRCSEYLITTYFYYSSSFRDFFSAGGKWEYNNVEFPQVINKLYLRQALITEVLETANSEFKEVAYKAWEELPIQFQRYSFQQDYKQVLNYLGNEYFNNELKTAKIEGLSQLLEL